MMQPGSAKVIPVRQQYKCSAWELETDEEQHLRGSAKLEISTSSLLQKEDMSSSSLRLSLSLMCLLVAVGVISCGRFRMEGPRGGPGGEEIPESFNMPELQWMLNNAELAPVQVDDPRIELTRRDSTVTTKPVNCMNYFWKSRTAC
ncbi:hypothetical protein NFI96_003777 [Prochilodus magdalenae]|nr:hypothetical protein NFI96_003777 [Prochilodus magdalenae]